MYEPWKYTERMQRRHSQMSSYAERSSSKGGGGGGEQPHALERPSKMRKEVTTTTKKGGRGKKKGFHKKSRSGQSEKNGEGSGLGSPHTSVQENEIENLATTGDYLLPQTGRVEPGTPYLINGSVAWENSPLLQKRNTDRSMA